MTPAQYPDFPSIDDNLRGEWFPIYIEPILGSGERFTVGVVAISGENFHVEAAPGLSRLECLYDKAAGGVVFAAEETLEAVSIFLRANGPRALKDFIPPFASLNIGSSRLSAGDTLVEIAKLGMHASSSLMTQAQNFALPEIQSVASTGGGITRLAREVEQVVTAKQPELKNAFNRPFRSTEKARLTRLGFVGERLIANFGVLRPRRLMGSIREIKTGLWDLSSYKEIESFVGEDAFEMLIERPFRPSPLVTQQQIQSLDEACAELEFEADKKQIRVRPLLSAFAIGRHILEKEAA